MLKIVILKLEKKNCMLTAGWQSVSNWIRDSWQECFLDLKPGSQSWKILLIISIESKYQMCLCLGQNVSEKTVSSDSLHRWQPYTINTMGDRAAGVESKPCVFQLLWESAVANKKRSNNVLRCMHHSFASQQQICVVHKFIQSKYGKECEVVLRYLLIEGKLM